MLNLFKNAIKKEPSTTNDGNNGDLDDFLGKGTGKDGQNSDTAASLSNTTNPKSNEALKSNGIDLGAEDFGLVIRDLDKEREELAKKQAVSAENGPTQGPMGTSERETAQTSNVANASGNAVEPSTEELPNFGENIGEIVSSDESFPSVDNQGEKSAENEGQGVTSEVAQSSQNESQRLYDGHKQ